MSPARTMDGTWRAPGSRASRDQVPRAPADCIGSLADACRHWLCPVWAARLSGVWQCCNEGAEAWLSRAAVGAASTSHAALRGARSKVAAKIDGVFRQALARLDELPTGAAVVLDREPFDLLVFRLDDATGRPVGIAVAAVTPMTIQRR